MAKSFKAHCPRCNGERACDVHGDINVSWDGDDDGHSLYGGNHHKLLQCKGCETVFYQLESWHSEDWDVSYNPEGEEELSHPLTITTYPEPERKNAKPDWVWTLMKIDLPLSAILDEVYMAAESGALILAAVGLRTALDRASEVLKIDPGHSLEDKVKTLLKEGFIGETEANTLRIVVDAGSAAAHRGWAPKPEEYRSLLAALEQFIHRTIASGTQTLEIASKIPPRHPRPKKVTAT